VPGGGVYLCYDEEDEWRDSGELEFDFARILKGVEDVGLEAEFDEVVDDEDVTFSAY